MKLARLRLAIAAPLLAFPLLACSDADFEKLFEFLGLVLLVLAVFLILALVLLVGSVWCLVANHTSPSRRTMIGGKVFGVLYLALGGLGAVGSVLQFFEPAPSIVEPADFACVGDGMAHVAATPDLSTLLVGLAVNALIMLFGVWSFYAAFKARERLEARPPVP